MIGQIDRNLPVVSLYSSIGDLPAYSPLASGTVAHWALNAFIWPLTVVGKCLRLTRMVVCGIQGRILDLDLRIRI
jgi:hypothetical protein